jgi:branched-subunit amino acid transport protein AzlD
MTLRLCLLVLSSSWLAFSSLPFLAIMLLIPLPQ